MSSNGRLQPHELAPIGQGNHRLRPAAAADFKRMAKAARADGITLSVTDSYRTLAQQHDCVRRKGLYSAGGLCAAPGTSPHGDGRAVDVNTAGGAGPWLRANAGRFGFTTIPREPWHWEHAGGSATSVNDPLTQAPPAELASLNPLDGIGDVVDVLLDAGTWKRVGLVLAGATLAYVGFRMVSADTMAEALTIPGGLTT